MTIPGLRSITTFLMTVMLIGGLTPFAVIFALTTPGLGGPYYATEVLPTLIFKAGLQGTNIGQASALGVMLLIAVLVSRSSSRGSAKARPRRCNRVSGRASLRLQACSLTSPHVADPAVCPACLWTVMASLSTNNEITLNALSPPSQLRFENYRTSDRGNIGRFVGNSLVISVSSAILIALGATLLGYALGRLDFPGAGCAHRGLRGIAFPVFAYLIPLTRTVRALHLPDARMAVILATTATFLPVPTLLMRSFFQTLPEELADAARVEGASEWQVFHTSWLPWRVPGFLPR